MAKLGGRWAPRGGGMSGRSIGKAIGKNVQLHIEGLQRFHASIARAVAEAPSHAHELIVKKIAFDTLSAVIRMSRVATGRYRAAWMAAGEAAGLPAFSGRGGGGTAEGVAKGWSEGSGLWGYQGGKPFIEMRNGVPYALSLEFGSGPHMILPRNKKVLRWEGKDGQVHFSAHAMHPGTRGYRILGRAIDRARKSLDQSSFKRFLGPSAK